MKLRYATGLLLGSFVIAHSVMPANAECATLAIEDEFSRSTAVFVGRAIAQSVATTPTLSWSRVMETTFEVEDVWKGKPEKTIRIRTCGGTVGEESITCGEAFHFVVDSRYVVFAEGEPLVTNTCHHTALVDRAEQTIQWLSKEHRLGPSVLAASQSTSAVTQAWGPSVQGLRMSISVSHENPSRAGAEFSVALENTGDSDFVMNLGSMLGNGKVMLPTAVRLVLTNSAGRIQELEFKTPPVAGRVDPFIVSLRAGSIYVLRTSLSQYIIPAMNNFDVKLASGGNRIAARFEGRGVEQTTSEMPGVALLNFWKGTAQSNTVEFDPPEPK
jgi:hypothetical protein